MDAKLLKKYAAEAWFQFNREVSKQLKGGCGELANQYSRVWFLRILTLKYLDDLGYLPSLLKEDSGCSDFTLSVLPSEDGTRESRGRAMFFKVCYRLHTLFPFLFSPEGDSSYTAVPEKLFGKNDLIGCLNESISKEILSENIEILGWLYQFFLSEQKKSLTAKTVPTEHLSDATQLFTPEWIAKYIVHNTLGEFLSAASEELDYYIVSESEQSFHSPEKSPEEIRVLDPACGAGHLLIEAYDVLKKIYLEKGYRLEKIPALILEKNLYGFDLDPHALSLARFVLLMKASEDDPNLFEREVKLNLECLNGVSSEVTNRISRFLETSNLPSNSFEELLKLFSYRGSGSLVQVPEQLSGELETLDSLVSANLRTGDKQKQEAAEMLLPLIRQAQLLSLKYDVVIENPPYMSQRFFPPELKEFIYLHFHDYKRDLFSAFIIRSLEFLKPGGRLGVMSPFVWMFISSYEKFREVLLSKTNITSLVQLEYSGFRDATVPICTFTLEKSVQGSFGDFIQLSSFKGADHQGPKVLEAAKDPTCAWRYKVNQNQFTKIPGSPFAFWAHLEMIKIFELGMPLREIAPTAIGLNSGDNKRFLRYWFEVDYRKISFSSLSVKEAEDAKEKWFPYNKGGQFRKWYGNLEFVINWENNGEEVKEYAVRRNKGKHWSRYIQNLHYMFRSGVTWTFVSSSRFGARFLPSGCLFDVAGSAAFPADEDRLLICGLLCSRYAFEALKILNPTLNFQAGNVGQIPIMRDSLLKDRKRIEKIAEDAISLARADWNDSETSWEFERSPLFGQGIFANTISETIKKRLAFLRDRFNKMRELEVENNAIIEKAFRLKTCLADSAEDQITLYLGSEEEEVRKLISYLIGCSFGRYNIKKSGIQYPSEKGAELSGGVMVLTDIGKFSTETLSCLKTIISRIWGREELNENVSYLGRVLGSSNGEEAILRYLQSSFYFDHFKLYKKRPIYWLVSSGRKKVLQFLVYIHSYNENMFSEMREKYLDPMLSEITETFNESRNKDLKRKMEELLDFDKKLAMLAENPPILDLNDGVRANIKVFEGLIPKV